MAKQSRKAEVKERKGVLTLDNAKVREAAIEGVFEAPSDGDGNAKARVSMFSGTSHTKTFFRNPDNGNEQEQIEAANLERDQFIDFVADLISNQEPEQ